MKQHYVRKMERKKILTPGGFLREKMQEGFYSPERLAKTLGWNTLRVEDLLRDVLPITPDVAELLAIWLPVSARSLNLVARNFEENQRL